LSETAVKGAERRFAAANGRPWQPSRTVACRW